MMHRARQLHLPAFCPATTTARMMRAFLFRELFILFTSATVKSSTPILAYFTGRQMIIIDAIDGLSAAAFSIFAAHAAQQRA